MWATMFWLGFSDDGQVGPLQWGNVNNLHPLG